MSIHTLFSYLTGLAFFLFALPMIKKGWGYWKIKQCIVQNSVNQIRDIQPGLVAFSAQAIPLISRESELPQLLKTPLALKSALYYSYRLSEYHRKRGFFFYSMPIKKGEETCIFCLEDETSQILLDPHNAEMKIGKNFNVDSFLDSDYRGRIASLLQSEGKSLPLGILKTIIYQENYIEPGDQIFILGTAVQENLPNNEWDTNDLRPLVIKKQKGQPFIITDDNKDLFYRLNQNNAYLFFFLGGFFLILSIMTLCSILLKID